MLLTVECLDQDTLCWRTLARHENVTSECAPMIVGVLRDGLPPAAVLRWNWSGRPRSAVTDTAPQRRQQLRRDRRRPA